MKRLVFWAGMILLIADLLSYYNQIRLYFTTLGIILLAVSIILLIVSFFMKERKK